jgi:hypothetical protein
MALDLQSAVLVGLIGAVDFWYDVTKTPPGKALAPSLPSAHCGPETR